MSRRVQLLCAWSGLGFVALFFLGFLVFAGFVPPPAPGLRPRAIAAVFAHNRTGIRIGMLLSVFASGLLCPWFAVISVQMKRIEGFRSPLAYTQMIAGAATVIEFIFPPMIWQTAAYRSERAAATVQTLNDLAWLPFLGIVCTAIVQGFVIGFAILADKRAEPIFPRWVGYFNIWICTLLTPGSLIVFFHHGPLAWNGLLAWWLVLASYFSWVVVLSVMLIRAIGREAPEAESAAPPPPTSAGAPSPFDAPALAAELSEIRRQLAELKPPARV